MRTVGRRPGNTRLMVNTTIQGDHERTHRKNARRFQCHYCKKYRGKNGFSRKDHLASHVKNYHHIDVSHLPGIAVRNTLDAVQSSGSVGHDPGDDAFPKSPLLEARDAKATPSPTPQPLITISKEPKCWGRGEDDPFPSRLQNHPTALRVTEIPWITGASPSKLQAKSLKRTRRRRAVQDFGNLEEDQPEDTMPMSTHMSMKQALIDRGEDIPRYAHPAGKTVSGYGGDYPVVSYTARNVKGTPSTFSFDNNTIFDSSVLDTPVLISPITSIQGRFSPDTSIWEDFSAGQTAKRPVASDARSTVRQKFDWQVGRNEANPVHDGWKDQDTMITHQQSGPEVHDSAANLYRARAQQPQSTSRQMGQRHPIEFPPHTPQQEQNQRQMRRKLLSSSPTAKSPDNASLRWITATKPDDFISNAKMRVVRSAAMASYLKTTKNHAGKQLGSSQHRSSIGTQASQKPRRHHSSYQEPGEQLREGKQSSELIKRNLIHREEGKQVQQRARCMANRLCRFISKVLISTGGGRTFL